MIRRNSGRTSQFHAACEWFGPGWTDFVATCPHSEPAGLGPILMSAHTGAKQKPASKTGPCPPTGVDASAAPTEGMILPDADSGDPTAAPAPPKHGKSFPRLAGTVIRSAPSSCIKAAVYVWMCKVKSAESSQLALLRAASAAQQAAFRQLKLFVEDLVCGLVAFCGPGLPFSKPPRRTTMRRRSSCPEAQLGHRLLQFCRRPI